MKNVKGKVGNKSKVAFGFKKRVREFMVRVVFKHLLPILGNDIKTKKYS